MALCAADCLLWKAPDAPGGMWSPGALLGEELVNRLREAAGMTFTVEETA
ncbi:hypothetical protein IM697_29640 [Streptomyces ferrugineus]|uniref:Uncharacterized protein n=1 Tax=Streptomyces ferrugineus TaxID=1413221 RepID=A0A7M2SD97_9ACTN|nr:hypothetical protein [Streptomyces ferrugineus]QOV34286.1 hypothetical protein IM697_29640 [Streptomyces ferrugineus]